MLRELVQPVWKIPKGKVATYGEVARAAGYPRGARQVAWALRAADGSIPWRRVGGAGGEIRLPGHAGMEQRLRLESEGVTFRGRRIRMDKHDYHFASVSRKKILATSRRTAS